MNSGTRVAVGVGAGYLLGRTRKMRLALMLAAAGFNGSLNGTPREALQKGIKQLGSSPQLAGIADTVRGELLTATKAAALAAASRRVDSLNERLQSSTGTLVPGGVPADDDTSDREPAGPDAESEEAEEAEEASEEQEEERARPAVRRSSATSRKSSTRRGTKSADADEPEKRRPAPRRRTTRSSSTTERAPVRRTRR